MKPIVVYYSRTGTTKKVGESIAKELSCPALEIIDLTKRSGPLGYLTGGRDAITKRLTQIEKIEKDLSKFDLFIIGTPNWGSTITPAIRTFIVEKEKFIKKVAFFCTSGGNNPGHIFPDLEELTSKPIATLPLTTSEVQSNTFEEKAKKFANMLKNYKE